MTKKGGKGDVWSPYGHEGARRALLAQRRAYIVLGAIAIAVLYAIFLQLTLDTETTAGSTTDEIKTSKQKPITVTVTPGRMDADSFVDATKEAPEGQGAPRPTYRPPNKVVEVLQPFLSLLAPLVVAFWLLSRVGTSARGKLAELNLGVYKGAMPYEMHTARGYKKVFTYRQVDAHVFGKAREDFLFGSYLEAPPLAVRRLLGEEIEGAEVTRLQKGGRPRVTVRTPEPEPTWVDRVLTPLKEARERVFPRDPRAARLRTLKRQGRAGA